MRMGTIVRAMLYPRGCHHLQLDQTLHTCRNALHCTPAIPVHCEVLKAKDIKQPNGSSDTLVLVGRRSVNGSIDLLYNPYKKPSIDSLKT